MRVYIEGVGLAGPGLDGWAAAQPILGGSTPYVPAPTRVPLSELLPAAERRRVGVPVRIALAVGSEAFAAAGRDPARTATVLASAAGDCDNVHHLCESLATSEREVSPTRFHNSVHNAAAGYWGIATRSHAASTSLSCHDASFAAGLLECGAGVTADRVAMALIAYDHPYPEPLNAVRRVAAPFGVALIAAPERGEKAIAALDIVYSPRPAAPTVIADAALEAIRAGVPAARSLPLLAALAKRSREALVLEYAGAHLEVTVMPC